MSFDSEKTSAAQKLAELPLWVKSSHVCSGQSRYKHLGATYYFMPCTIYNDLRLRATGRQIHKENTLFAVTAPFYYSFIS